MYLPVTDSSHVWQSALAVDHDYIGSAETVMEQSSEDTFSANGHSPTAPEDALLERDLVLSKSNTQPEFVHADSSELPTTISKQWSAPHWTPQHKTEDT